MAGHNVGSKEIRRRIEEDYSRLKSEYNADAGGYNVKINAGMASRNEFIKSDFTPQQGGYYADKSFIQNVGRGDGKTSFFYDEARAKRITGYLSDIESKKQLKSALKPYKNVNRSLLKSRKTSRRQKSLKRGRIATILSGKLGPTDDDRTKRKTLLG